MVSSRVILDNFIVEFCILLTPLCPVQYVQADQQQRFVVYNPWTSFWWWGCRGAVEWGLEKDTHALESNNWNNEQNLLAIKDTHLSVKVKDAPPSSNIHHTSMVPLGCLRLNWLAEAINISFILATCGAGGLHTDTENKEEKQDIKKNGYCARNSIKA